MSIPSISAVFECVSALLRAQSPCSIEAISAEIRLQCVDATAENATDVALDFLSRAVAAGSVRLYDDMPNAWELTPENERPAEVAKGWTGCNLDGTLPVKTAGGRSSLIRPEAAPAQTQHMRGAEGKARCGERWDGRTAPNAPPCYYCNLPTSEPKRAPESSDGDDLAPILVEVKGDRFEAARAAADRGIGLAFVREIENGSQPPTESTVGRVSPALLDKLRAWHNEPATADRQTGFPPGVLVCFNDPAVKGSGPRPEPRERAEAVLADIESALRRPRGETDGPAWNALSHRAASALGKGCPPHCYVCAGLTQADVVHGTPAAVALETRAARAESPAVASGEPASRSRSAIMMRAAADLLESAQAGSAEQFSFPNMDSMEPDELSALAEFYATGADMAGILRDAKFARIHGNIPEALKLERLSDDLGRNLPQTWTW